MDLVEADDHYVLRADLPGMDEKNVSIEINDNVLTVSGERRDEQEQTRSGWHRVERSFGRFTRSLTLPEGIDPEAISASFDKGVLSITVPKPEQRKPRRVQITPGRESPAENGAAHEAANGGPVEGTATERPTEGASAS
jgi:HSP20 family protein